MIVCASPYVGAVQLKKEQRQKMSNVKAIGRPPGRHPRRDRPNIQLPDGEVLIPRPSFATEIGVSVKTATRMNLPTVYIGNVAFVAKNASLKILAGRLKRRNQPPVRRYAARRGQRRGE